MIAGFIGVQGCFAKDTLVRTIDGLKPIQEVDSVLSYDYNGHLVSMPCMVVKTKKVAYEVMISDGESFVCSAQHKFFTKQGLVEAKDLKPQDRFLSFHESRPKRKQKPGLSPRKTRWTKKESGKVLIDSETGTQMGVLLMPEEEYEQELRLNCASQGLRQHEQLSRELGCFVPIVSLQSPLPEKKVTGIRRITNEEIEMYDLVVPETNNFLLANGVLTHNSGKTLSMVRETIKYYLQGYKIYSNFHLEIPYEPLNFKKLFEMAQNQENLSDVVILLDEVHILLDSRGSMRKENKTVTFWLNQARKQRLVIYYTTQHESQIDLRLRNATNFFSFCDGFKTTKEALMLLVRKKKIKDPRIIAQIKKLDDGEEAFYVFNEISNGQSYQRDEFIGNPFFKYYNTNEVVGFLDSDGDSDEVAG